MPKRKLANIPASVVWANIVRHLDSLEGLFEDFNRVEDVDMDRRSMDASRTDIFLKLEKARSNVFKYTRPYTWKPRPKDEACLTLKLLKSVARAAPNLLFNPYVDIQWKEWDRHLKQGMEIADVLFVFLWKGWKQRHLTEFQMLVDYLIGTRGYVRAAHHVRSRISEREESHARRCRRARQVMHLMDMAAERSLRLVEVNTSTMGTYCENPYELISDQGGSVERAAETMARVHARHTFQELVVYP